MKINELVETPLCGYNDKFVVETPEGTKKISKSGLFSETDTAVGRLLGAIPVINLNASLAEPDKYTIISQGCYYQGGRVKIRMTLKALTDITISSSDNTYAIVVPEGYNIPSSSRVYGTITVKRNSDKEVIHYNDMFYVDKESGKIGQNATTFLNANDLVIFDAEYFISY